MLTPECAATETPPSDALKKPDETLMLAMPPNVPPPTATSTAPVESTPPAPVPPLPQAPPAPATPPIPKDGDERGPGRVGQVVSNPVGRGSLQKNYKERKMR